MPNEVVTLQQAVRDKRYAKETSHVGARNILLGKNTYNAEHILAKCTCIGDYNEGYIRTLYTFLKYWKKQYSLL
jgi:hypothetical protein